MDESASPRPFRFPSARLTLAGWEWGDPAAPPLLLIQGGRDLARSWDAVAQAFATTHYVIAPDLRGHGDSDWAGDGGYAMLDFVVDLGNLVVHSGLERFDLVGHSLGGNIAWRYAAAFPERVRRLTIIEGLGYAAAKQAALEARPLAARMRDEILAHQSRRTRRVYPDLAAATARLRAANPRLSEQLADHLIAHATQAVPEGIVFRHDPCLGPKHEVDLTMAERQALWGSLPMPVLLVYGRDSWATDPETDGRAAAFRDARRILFDDAGHWVQHDRTEAFVAALREFLG